MTKEYRYKLQKGSKKSLCPECNNKTFVQYIDTNTSDLLPEQYGRCDRESKCSYHLNPYKDGYSKMIFEKERGEYSGNWKPQARKIKHISKPLSFIPIEVFKKTLKPEGYEMNVFIQNILSRVPYPFEMVEVEKIISQYYLGTVCNGYRAGAITFPFIDKGGNVRAIQVKQFDETNHTTGTDFLHSIIEKHQQRKNEALPLWLNDYKNNEKIVSCLFGEHLLNKHSLNPIALVEAPKTAVYCSLYFGLPESPENLLWLAVYNLSSLNLDKCKALQGKDVYLFPDLSKDGKSFELWSNKAKELTNLLPGTRFIVSDLLETFAPTELKEKGADIADVLIKMDWRKFKPGKVEALPSIEQPKLKPIPKSEKGENSEAPKQTYFFNKQDAEPLKKESWGYDIAALENYFAGIVLPKKPVKFKQGETIKNISLFIETHFLTIKRYEGNETFLPYLNRLQELKHYLIINAN
ncbi:DUF6371 domain-containing protein [Ferruginibacter lapsinanis]|uniref:DUF6965 family protein n=1 Tax=Ferruginibacter lapsinanis TaxID=563172 RepID=UPI001E5D8EEE|nr:DUF6371 domain-containing protein [Ferruginibacter lapsinanis]UEG50870.1 DUF6371 domain-containing protein [Ferruginibacter lapsinanis]